MMHGRCVGFRILDFDGNLDEKSYARASLIKLNYEGMHHVQA